VPREPPAVGARTHSPTPTPLARQEKTLGTHSGLQCSSLAAGSTRGAVGYLRSNGTDLRPQPSVIGGFCAKAQQLQVRSSPVPERCRNMLHGSVRIPIGRIHRNVSPQKPPVAQDDVAVATDGPSPSPHVTAHHPRCGDQAGRRAGRPIPRSSLGSCQPKPAAWGPSMASCRPEQDVDPAIRATTTWKSVCISGLGRAAAAGVIAGPQGQGERWDQQPPAEVAPTDKRQEP